MDDDKKLTHDEDEFHFTEAEEVEKHDKAYLRDTPAYSEQRSRFNRRNILVVIGLLVLAFSIYKLIGVFRGGEKKPTLPTAIVAPKAVPEPPKPIVQAPPPPPATIPPDLQKQLATIQGNLAETNQQIAAITTQLSSLGTTVDTLSTTVTTLNDQLQSLSAQVDTLRIIAAPKKRPIVHKRRIIIKEAILLPRWVIQALLPDRAWLIADNGQMITVKIGSILPGYGRIILISAVQGFVKTSSGAILHFEGI